MLSDAMPMLERGNEPLPLAGGHALSQEMSALRPVVRAVVACVLGERKDHPDVEDCTHEALRRALEGHARLREGEALRPWLLGIARHVALDARKSRRRTRREAPATGEGEPDAALPLEELADPGPGPDERAAGAEQGRKVAAALRALPEAQREAVILFHVEGEDYQRIAERLGVPMGTVATWLARGRRALAAALADVEAG
jgi:RNA polymerase sigma factor (sigma-70 family)